MAMAELARRNGLPVWASALASGWIAEEEGKRQ
jgi:hypothetical protein